MRKKGLIIVGSILLTLILALSGVIVLTTGAEEGEPNVVIAAQNVAFKDSVYLIYAVKADNVPTGAEKGMLFWLSPQEAYTIDNAAIKLTDSTAEEINMGAGKALYDVYELNQLAARQMADDVYAVAYIKDGDTVYYSAPVKYSILQYVYNIRKKGTADEKLLNLLNAMLDYGTAAQLYTGYQTDRLANGDFRRVTVVGGVLEDGFKTGLYMAGTTFTLTAPETANDMVFSCWQDSDGVAVGSTNVVTLTTGSRDMTYTPVYLPNYSRGMSFVSNGDGTCYVNGIGTCTDAAVIIPDVSPDGDTVTSIGDYAFEDYTGITSVVIPDSVLSIGNGAFGGCTGLKSVIIPDSVMTIGRYAFSYCSGVTISCEAAAKPDGWASSWNSDNRPVVWGYNQPCLEHTAMIDPAVAATCTESGMTEGSHCSVCGQVIVEQAKINALGHNYVEGVCTRCGDIHVSTGFAFASNGDGTCTLTGIGSCTDTVLNIPSVSPDGDTVTAIDEKAFASDTNIIKVIIPDTVTTIGRRAFYECSSLTEVRISASVTDIGAGIIYKCPALKTVYYESAFYSSENNPFADNDAIEHVVFNGPTIPAYILQNRANIKTIEVGDNVQTIGEYAFAGCTGVETITVPSDVSVINNNAFQNVLNLVYYGKAFALNANWGARYRNRYMNNHIIFNNENQTQIIGYSKYLSGDVVIPGTVTSLGDYAFDGCSAMTSVTIPDSIKTIGQYAFRNCTGLTSVIIPDSVTSIGSYAFSGCAGLTSVIIPDSVTSIGSYVFSGCTGLTSVIIPDSMTYISDYAFRNCTGLTSVTIPDSVKSIGGYAFSGCTGLTSITIPDSVTSIGNYTFSGCTGLTSVTIPDSVMSVGNHAFENCSGLTSITIPDSVAKIDSYAFTGVLNIVYHGTAGGAPWSAKFYNKYTENGFIFTDETKTELIGAAASIAGDILIPDTVTRIANSAFSGCSKLTSVVISNSVTSIGDYAFNNCSGLLSVTIPNSVTSIGKGAFYNASRLNDVYVPDSVISIGSNAFYGVLNVNYQGTAAGTGWGARFFNKYVENGLVYEDQTMMTLLGCSRFVTGEVIIPDSVTGISGYAFDGCSSITTVTIPDSVKSIGSYAFQSCSGLTSVVIPDSVESIGSYAFQSCGGLTSVIIPVSVTYIGDYAFNSCNKLTIKCNAVSTPSGWSSYWNRDGRPVIWGYVDD